MSTLVAVEPGSHVSGFALEWIEILMPWMKEMKARSPASRWSGLKYSGPVRSKVEGQSPASRWSGLK